MIRRSATIAMLLALAVAPTCMAGPYWAGDDGAVLRFGWYELHVSAWADWVSHTWPMMPGFGSSDSYRLGADGDVIHVGGSYLANGFAEGFEFVPPVLLLDLPLDPGKTWSTESIWYDPNFGAARTVVSGQVLGPTTTAVPGFADQVPVIVVRMLFTYPEADESVYLEDREEIWLLHERLGLVNGLTAWEGIVPTVPRGWSGLKALFR
ncbi:MAG: hypothetical protein IH621_06780 [Krumholzibacteria bacterium]|nr:hypothetical protein [Candidatus Krumholzibacteria bacterium]